MKLARGKAYVPDRGDVVWLEFTPQSGHEQAGRRPALVISLKSYNNVAGLALVCPITSRVKGYPFEVQLPTKGKIFGVVLSDQLKSLDWQARHASFIAKVPEVVVEDVIAKVHALLSLSA